MPAQLLHLLGQAIIITAKNWADQPLPGLCSPRPLMMASVCAGSQSRKRSFLDPQRPQVFLQKPPSVIQL